MGHGNQFLNDGINFTPQATAVTGRQRSESAGRLGQGFPNKSEHGFACFVRTVGTAAPGGNAPTGNVLPGLQKTFDRIRRLRKRLHDLRQLNADHAEVLAGVGRRNRRKRICQIW